MKKLEIYDPAMCCSTGVCGPSVDSELLRVAATVNALRENGIEIRRHSLSNEPEAFVSNKVINDLLQKDGAGILPVTLVDGEVVKTEEYPTNEEFSQWLGITIRTKQPDKNNNCCCDGGGGDTCC